MILGIIASAIFKTISQSPSIYVSASGDDNNDGLTPSTPWQTLAKVEAEVSNNDIVAFNGGDIFLGSLNLASKVNVSLISYGTGKATISGRRTFGGSGWTEESPNLWYRAVTGEIYGVRDKTAARLPKILDNYDTNDYYYDQNYFKVDSKQAALTFTSSGLVGIPSLVGGRMHFMASDWEFDLLEITAHNPATGQVTVADTFGTLVGQTLDVGEEFWVTGVKELCTQDGEWFYDSVNSRLYVYNTGSAPTSAICTENSGYGISLANCDQIKIDNISVNHYYSGAVFADNCNNLLINDLNVTYTYLKGIKTDGESFAPVITNSFFRWIAGNAVEIEGFLPTNTELINSVIENNQFFDIGTLPNITHNSITRNFTIFVGGQGTSIRYNKIQRVGLNGIKLLSNYGNYSYNLITDFCLALHDGGGMYWGNGSWAKIGADFSVAEYNIILGTGNYPDYWFATCMYMDDRTKDSEVRFNTLAYGAKALHYHNTRNMNVHDNVAYGCTVNEVYFKSDDNGADDGDVSGNYRGENMFGNKLENNILFSLKDVNTNPSVLLFSAYTEVEDPSYEWADFNNNKYYSLHVARQFQLRNPGYDATSRLGLNAWKAYSGKDAGSVQNISFLPFYNVANPGANQITNGDMSNGIVGWIQNAGGTSTSVVNNTTHFTISTNTTNGLLRAPAFNPSANLGVEHEARVTMRNVSGSGKLTLEIIKLSPYAYVKQYFNVYLPENGEWIDINFPFTPVLGQSHYFEFRMSTIGDVMDVKNVEVRTADLSPAIDSFLAYNSNNSSAANINLPAGTWYELDGTPRTGTVLIQPSESKILTSQIILTET